MADYTFAFDPKTLTLGPKYMMLAHKLSNELNLAAEIGAELDDSEQVLVLYIPDRDREGIEIGD